VIKLPKKKYTPRQDVQLGKEAASEVRKQYPIIEDQHIAKYLTQIGNRLVAAAPTELKQSVYEYSFTPVNLKDINAFALPADRCSCNAACSTRRPKKRKSRA
jgi:predicted Zn-dependent protease